MKLFYKIKNLHDTLSQDRGEGFSIGFVPTMGALHEGHLALVKQALSENHKCVCSIFVNPTQFNNPEDLKKYPRQEAEDIALLESIGCDYLFCPSVEEMYPENNPSKIIFDFGAIERVMEGADRPGHFQGVASIVKNLFEIVNPNKSYFGKKDYQQLAIIKSLASQYSLSTEIVGCDIVRENDGLAMSSRNQRLSSAQRKAAPFIYSVLLAAKKLSSKMTISELKQWVSDQINGHDLMKLGYFEISDAESLAPLLEWKKDKATMGFIVVYMGDVRLIDNIELN